MKNIIDFFYKPNRFKTALSNVSFLLSGFLTGFFGTDAFLKDQPCFPFQFSLLMVICGILWFAWAITYNKDRLK